LRAVAAIALAMLAAAPPALAQKAAKCTGRDMLQELKVKEPDVFAAIDTAAKATPNTQSLLWRIDREGLPPSWLFGTIHLSDERVEAKAVMLEVADLSPTATQSVMAEAADLFLFSDGRRLDAMLSKEEFETVKSTLAGAGMPGELGAMFKPWIIYMILSVSECERRKVQAGATVVDMAVAETARKRGLPVLGLETVKEQLVSLATIPDPQQIDMLRATLKWAKRTDDLMETVLQLYLRREMGAAWPFQIALARKAGIDPGQLSVFYKAINTERNKRMRERALPQLQKGGTFIAVGALHLGGEEGLVALLRESGFTVTAME
jgi:uncharacterized protein YbaP (TraB family)